MPVQQRTGRLEGQGTGSRADRARAACVPDDGGGDTPRGRISPLVRPAGLAGRRSIRGTPRSSRGGRPPIPGSRASSGIPPCGCGSGCASHGFEGSYPSVRRWVKRWRERHRAESEGYARLAWARGAAQAGFRPGVRVDRGRGACGAFPGGLVPVSGHAVCRGVAGRDVGVCVPRAGRGVRVCRDGAARGGVRATSRAWGIATRMARSRRP